MFISFFPVFLLAKYIYNKDSSKESKSLLIGLFTSGVLAVIIVTIVNLIIMILFPQYYVTSEYNNFNFLTLFLLLFLEVSLVEEGSKWLMIKLFGYRSKEFDQIYDIIVYSVFVSLGFAAMENFLYVVEGGLSLGIYRAIFSVPAHASFGVLMGYFLGLVRISRFTNKFLYLKNIVFSILVPTFFHTIYNFCLLSNNIYFLLLFLVFVCCLYCLSIKKVNQFAKIEKSLD